MFWIWKRGCVETNHLPAHDPIFYHQVSHEWCVDFAHIFVVVFLAHVWLAVCADGPAEETFGV
jgi:hypothetical protein